MAEINIYIYIYIYTHIYLAHDNSDSISDSNNDNIESFFFFPKNARGKTVTNMAFFVFFKKCKWQDTRVIDKTTQ